MGENASARRQGFWTTLPGVLTGVAGLIVAATGLIAGLHTAGLIGDADRGEGAVPPVGANVEIDGTWLAEVVYDWGDAYTEAFKLRYVGDQVHGSASFLGTDRGILEGRLEGNKLTFVTKTEESAGYENTRTATHHYTGIVTADEIAFIMLTEGGFSAHTPIEFKAQRKGL